MKTISPILRIRCSGPRAIFTRPELKTERFSYSVPSPSAMRGVLESILWKPAIRWSIHKIHILNPIKFTSFRRNEVNTKASAPAARIIQSGGEAPVLFADDDRAQRNTVALCDVDYLVEARFSMTAKAGEGENVAKFQAMFERRLERGQNFQQPFFGCRECVADVRPAEGDEKAISESADLGLMLWDISFGIDRGRQENVPVFYWAKMVDGVIDVPPSESTARDTLAEYQKAKGNE